MQTDQQVHGTFGPTIADRYPAYVGGRWSDEPTHGCSEVFDPSTGEVLATVVNAGLPEVEAAVAVGLAAQRRWWESGWEARALALQHIADDLSDRSEEFARIEARNGGIAIRGARRDVSNAVRYLRYFAGLASELKGHTLEASTATVTTTFREPYRLVGRIVPFNHPLQFAVAAVAAPLAAGNGVVLKPAQQTPISALHFAALAARHLPEGLLSVLPGGAEVGAAIVGHPDIPRIGFTGSVPTGKAVLRQSADHIKAVSLELGGKNPMIVGPDVAPEIAADRIVTGMNLLRTAGQSCGSASRIYVHEDRYAETERRVAEAFAALRPGPALDETSDMGPLVSRVQQQRVLEMVDQAQADGADLLVGGHPSEHLSQGFFVAPAVFGHVDSSAAIATEEIFGPVISLHAWSSESTVVEQVNALPLGLTANILTNDLSLAMRLSRAAEVGYVWINGRAQRPFGAPFGGYKQSGLGSENTLEELLSYTRTKNINLSEFPVG